MSLNSTLKKKPMSAVATLDLNLSAQHSLQNAKADEKIHAGSGNGRMQFPGLNFGLPASVFSPEVLR